MHSTDPILRLMGRHVLPGVFFVVLSSLLLCLWELRRLTSGDDKTTRRWLLPVGGLVLGLLSIAFIMARFITVD
jgi:hypothetical protein